MHPSIYAARSPEKIAYVMADTGAEFSYGELERRSNQLAHLWRSIGCQRGDTIALLLENNEWFLPICWSAQRSGLYFTCISPSLAPADIAYILSDSTARTVIGSHATRASLEAGLGDRSDVTVFLIDADLEGDPRCLLSVVGRQPDTPIPDESAGLDMLYSSGTTGRPKGIRRALPEGLPGEAPSPGLAIGQKHYLMDERTVYLSPAPLYHSGPLRWSMVVQRLGGTVVIMSRFDAEHALQLIEKYRVTSSQWVPTHFVKFLQLPEAKRTKYALDSMRSAFHAAAPCPVPVKEAMMAWWGPIVHEFYGGTENNGLTLISPEEWLSHRGSVGRAVVGKLRICDDDGNELPPRSEGTVYFSDGPTFTYHNDAEKTASTFNRHGWSTLGDVGWVDEDGYLYLTDRKSFMIISGGVNIYPQEIENALILHPQIADVAVIGAPDDVMGERVVAVVQARDGVTVSTELGEEIRSFAREQLGSVKAPKQIDFRETLPREANGKLYKRLLRDEYWKKAG